MVEYINALELVLFGLAFWFSRSKYTPGILICYNLWVWFMNGETGARMEYINKLYYAGTYTYQKANTEVMILYLQVGITCGIFAAVAILLKTRLSYLTGLVILAQSALQLLVGMCIYYEVTYNIDVSKIIDTHFVIDGFFVILYVLIAWMCVYWSRKTSNYD
ncbi:membrane protein [Vibrio phage 340E47.2]|nr:membrane protein [Vibrio phage 340E47.2]QZI91923.1 hypothetical protein PODOV077v1_p0012 [Vibrio phage 5P1a]